MSRGGLIVEGVQWIINGLIGVAAALFGWIANDMKRRIELLESANCEGGQHVAVLQSQMDSVLGDGALDPALGYVTAYFK